MDFNIFIRRAGKADPLLGVFSANSKMSLARETTASNSYRLVPRTTGANTVQQNCWKVSGFRLIKERVTKLNYEAMKQIVLNEV